MCYSFLQAVIYLMLSRGNAKKTGWANFKVCVTPEEPALQAGTPAIQSNGSG